LNIRKIKLAFRPGNVDLADTQSATIAIDDPRFFGNIVPDQDYPELEDIAFSQNMLSNFVSLQAARGRTIASQQDTTQDDSDFHDFRNSTVSESPMLVRKRQTTPLSNRSVGLLDIGHIPGEDWRGDNSIRSRLSEIEMMRGESRPERGISGAERASLSTMRTSISSGGGLAMRFDDDIPAFDDQIDDFGNEEAPPMSYFQGNMNDVMPERDNMNDMDNMNMDHMEGDVDPMQDVPVIEKEIDVNVPDEEEKASSPVEATGKVPKARARKAPQNKAKRQRVAVDESVELSSRVIKQRMADLRPILRREPEDHMVRLPKKSSQLAVRGAVPVPPSARGLCPELQSLFAMTMTSSERGLPFPLKRGEVRPASKGGARSAEKGNVGASGHDRESLSIDAVRDNSVESASEARRASSLLLGDAEFNDSSQNQNDIENDVDKGYSPQQSMQPFGEEGAGDFGPLDQNNDYGEGYQDNMNDVEPYDSKYGQEEDDVRPGAGALKSKEDDLMGDRGGRGKETIVAARSEKRASGFSVRTAMVRDVLKDQLKESDSVSFSSISRGISRRTAAACFLEVSAVHAMV
jgi:hypothetical protein